MLSRSWPARSLFRPSDFRFFDVPTPTVPLNVTQDEEKFVVRVELPGMKPEDISVAAEKNQLTIAAKRTIATDEKATYRRRERVEGSFERSFALPQPFDADKVEAKYADGVLTVTLPKSAEAKPRKIAVTAVTGVVKEGGK